MDWQIVDSYFSMIGNGRFAAGVVENKVGGRGRCLGRRLSGLRLSGLSLEFTAATGAPSLLSPRRWNLGIGRAELKRDMWLKILKKKTVKNRERENEEECCWRVLSRLVSYCSVARTQWLTEPSAALTRAARSAE